MIKTELEAIYSNSVLRDRVSIPGLVTFLDTTRVHLLLGSYLSGG